MKRTQLLAMVLVLALLAVMVPQRAVADDYEIEMYESAIPITVSVDGAYVPTDVDPYLEKGRTLMPLRFGAAAIGAEVTWNSRAKQAVLTKGSNTLVFGLNQTYFMKNGKRMALDVPLQIRRDRIMLPLRAFAEALDVDVDWEGATATVGIFTGAPVVAPAYKNQFPQAVQWLIEKYYSPGDVNDITGSWWRIYHDEWESEYAAVFIYAMPDGAYAGVDLTYEVLDNGITATEVSGLTPTTYGSSYISAHERGQIFATQRNSVYYNVPPRGYEADLYTNYVLTQNGNLWANYFIECDPMDEVDEVYRGEVYFNRL